MSDITFPLGSIISFQGKQALIVGYTFLEEANHMQRGYVVVPYPEGYRNPSSLKVISQNQLEMIQMGYECEMSRYITDYFSKVNELASKISSDEFGKICEKMLNDISEEGA